MAANKERQTLGRIVSNNLYMLRFVARHTPSYFVGMIVEGIVWGIIHACTSVIFVKMLFDRLENGVGFEPTASVVGLMAAFSLVTHVFHVWYWHWYNPMIQRRLHQKMQEELFSHVQALDLACYDNPAFYNDFLWAINESDSRVCRIVEDIGKLVNRCISTLTIAGVLLTIDKATVIIIFSFVAFSAMMTIKQQKETLHIREESMPHERKGAYITRVFSLPDYAKELRLSSADELLVDEYQKVMDNQRSIVIRYGKKLFSLFALNATVRIGACEVGVNLILLYKLMVMQTISLGGFAAAHNAVWKLYWQINNMTTFLMKFPEHSLYAEKFRTFMEYKPQVTGGEADVPVIRDIRFEQVSFTYPGTNQQTLRNVDLQIRRGEKIAIVGYNGAGKSTLVKLLLHLYNPTSGQITLNGTDIRDFKLTQYKRKIGVVFQDYQIFAATVAENVLGDEYHEEQYDTVISALESSGFSERLAALPHGIHTILTREFDENGVNLSGGEAQKIAIARMVAQNCELIIMDEPSSALDPVAEYNLNQMILSYAENKTVVFISHRLSTTRMADRIYMFDKGELIEQGTHEALMLQNGKYAEMFRMQAEKYSVV